MKHSAYIEYPMALALIHSALDAVMQATPWNCFITISPEMVGVEAKNVSPFVRKGLKRLQRYYERRGMAFSCCWVLENSPKTGVHAHILIHRPKNMPMHPMKYWWAVLKRFQLERVKGVLKLKKFYRHQPYEQSLSKLVSYLLKGVRALVVEHLNREAPLYLFLEDYVEQQGAVIGKRIGVMT